jgi:hypothetical protein
MYLFFILYIFLKNCWVIGLEDCWYFILCFPKMSNSLMDSYLNESNKLDGENYVNWKFKLQTLMEGFNVWSIACGDEAKPTTSTTSVQDWERRENKEKVLLRMSIKDNIIPHIRECKMSQETWEVLKGLYEMDQYKSGIVFKKKASLNKNGRK